jgi:hypothetical protein
LVAGTASAEVGHLAWAVGIAAEAGWVSRSGRTAVGLVVHSSQASLIRLFVVVTVVKIGSMVPFSRYN